MQRTSFNATASFVAALRVPYRGRYSMITLYIRQPVERRARLIHCVRTHNLLLIGLLLQMTYSFPIRINVAIILSTDSHLALNQLVAFCKRLTPPLQMPDAITVPIHKRNRHQIGQSRGLCSSKRLITPLWEY